MPRLDRLTDTSPPNHQMKLASLQNVGELVRTHLRIVLIIVCLVVLIGLFRLTSLQDWFHLENLRALLRAHQTQGIALFVGLFILGNLLHIPGWIFVAASVLVLGRMGGGLATYLAASLSCAITFLLVRLAGGNAMQKIPYAFAQRLLVQLHKYPVRNTILLRTAFQTLPSLNYALALSGLRFRAYMVGTLLGLPLPIAVYCIFFDAIAQRMQIGT